MEEDTNAGTSGGGSFRFDFFGDGSGPAGSPDEAKAEAEAVAPALPPPLDPGPWGREALLLPAHVLLPGAGAAGQPERVRVMWEESVGQYGGLVAVEMLEGDRWRKGRVRKVAPWRLAASSLRENPPAPPTGHLEEHDLIFHDQHHRHTPAAPPLGPSLASLIYPVLPGRFLREIYGRKALAVHELGGRVEGVLRDLNVASGGSGGVAAAMAGDGGGKRKRNRKRGVGASYLAAPPPANATDSLDVAALLRAATRTVVWMRAQDGGREMQYLEVPPEVAWACYRAGHSLYFNPPLAFQRPYVIAVLRALGMGMGVGAGAEDGEGGLGGDVEVFAVRGPHVTPWHFDAQVGGFGLGRFRVLLCVWGDGMLTTAQTNQTPTLLTRTGQHHHPAAGVQAMAAQALGPPRPAHQPPPRLRQHSGAPTGPRAARRLLPRPLPPDPATHHRRLRHRPAPPWLGVVHALRVVAPGGEPGGPPRRVPLHQPLARPTPLGGAAARQPRPRALGRRCAPGQGPAGRGAGNRGGRG